MNDVSLDLHINDLKLLVVNALALRKIGAALADQIVDETTQVGASLPLCILDLSVPHPLHRACTLVILKLEHFLIRHGRVDALR